MLRSFESSVHSIPEAVYQQAQLNPDKLCLIDVKERVTYGELWEKVNLAYQYLIGKDIKHQEPVLVECDQSIQYFAILLAIQLAHAIFVPVEMRASEETIDRMMKETEAHHFISVKEAQSISQVSIQGNTAEYEFPQYDEIAEILFTTGSTGQSKGIVLTHKNNIAVAQNVIFGVEMKDDNLEIIPTPTSHSHGLRRTYANLLNGSAAILLNGVMNVKAFFGFLDEELVTGIDLTPSAFQILHKLTKRKLANYNKQLEYIQFGSAKLADSDKDTLRELLPDVRLYDFYGSTEAGCSCIFDFNKHPDKSNCIGKPSHNSDFVAVDTDTKTIIDSSIDNLGLISSRGHMLMKGYWNQPELTQSAMHEGYLLTNDLGYIDDEGFVYMLGRNDFIINFGGIKINPEELETILFRYEGFKDCAVIGMGDPISGEVPVVLYTLKEGEEYDRQAFQNFIKENVDNNKQPKRFIKVQAIPRAQNGKVLRKKLNNLI